LKPLKAHRQRRLRGAGLLHAIEQKKCFSKRPPSLPLGEGKGGLGGLSSMKRKEERCGSTYNKL